MSTLAQTIEKTSRAFAESYVKASQAKDMKLLSAQLTDDCRHSIGPPAFADPLVGPGFSMSNAEYAAQFNDMKLYEMYDTVIDRVVVDTQQLKSVVKSEIFVRFHNGDIVTRNFIFFLDLNADGSKIVNIFQQNDTEEANKWLQDIKARKQAMSVDAA